MNNLQYIYFINSVKLHKLLQDKQYVAAAQMTAFLRNVQLARRGLLSTKDIDNIPIINW